MGHSGLGQKRLKRALNSVSLKDKPRNCRSLWLDSGAHSLFNKWCFTHTKNGATFKLPNERYKWYSKDGKNLSKRFIAYMDRYADFIRTYGDGIDYYATVDVIYNPELSWKSLNYLVKEHGLKPVPVIHHRTPLHWLDKHLEAGFTYIGLGGLGQQSTKSSYFDWADRVFNRLCAGDDRLPCVRVHGFALLSYELLLRYPFWSVDSTTAFKVAGNGSILVPHKRNGEFTFAVEPYIIGISHRSSAHGKVNGHYSGLTKAERKIIGEWLNEIEVPVGVMGENEEVIEYGVSSEYHARVVANLKFYQRLCDWLPEWPWPFKVKPKCRTDTFFQPEDVT
jgi:hypothetical protein